jgi:TetR/AcrR family transcriptional regulator, cholesterol catabolism regulator
LSEVEEPAKANVRMAEILDSAAKFFYTKGYHATSIEDVARDVGMLKGSLYYYIKSKEDLLYGILLGVIKQGTGGVEKALEGVQNPVERLEKGIEQHVEHIIRNQVRVGLFLHEFDSLSGRRKQRVHESLKEYQKIFTGIIKDGQASGAFISGDPDLLVNAMLGMCNWIYRWYHKENSPKLEVMKKTYIGLIMGGIMKRER